MFLQRRSHLSWGLEDWRILLDREVGEDIGRGNIKSKGRVVWKGRKEEQRDFCSWSLQYVGKDQR